MPVKVIARVMKVSRNTVRAAIAVPWEDDLSGEVLQGTGHLVDGGP